MIRSDGIGVKRDWQLCRRSSVENRWTSFYISLNRLGDMVLNREAYRIFGEPDAMLLMYDRDGQAIGLRPLGSSDQENAFPVRPRGNRGGYRIRANRLLREFGIEISDTIIFTNCHKDRNGIFILNIDESETLKPKERW